MPLHIKEKGKIPINEVPNSNNKIEIIPINQSASLLCIINIPNSITNKCNTGYKKWTCPECSFSRIIRKNKIKDYILHHLCDKHDSTATLKEIMVSRGIPQEVVDTFTKHKQHNRSEPKQCPLCNKILKEKNDKKTLSWKTHMPKHIKMIYNAHTEKKYINQIINSEIEEKLKNPIITLTPLRKTNEKVIEIVIPFPHIEGQRNIYNKWEFKCSIENCTDTILLVPMRNKDTISQTRNNIKIHILKKHYKETLQQNPLIDPQRHTNLFAHKKICPILGCTKKYSTSHFLSHIVFKKQ